MPELTAGIDSTLYPYDLGDAKFDIIDAQGQAQMNQPYIGSRMDEITESNNGLAGAAVGAAGMAAGFTPWGRVGKSLMPFVKSAFTPKPTPSIIGSTIQGGSRGMPVQTNYSMQPFSGKLTNAAQIGNKTSPYGQVQPGHSILNRDLGSAYNKNFVKSQIRGVGRKKQGPLGSQSKDATAANLKKFNDAQGEKMARFNGRDMGVGRRDTMSSFMAKQVKALWGVNRNFDAVKYIQESVKGSGGKMSTQEAKAWLARHGLRQPGPLTKKAF